MLCCLLLGAIGNSAQPSATIQLVVYSADCADASSTAPTAAWQLHRSNGVEVPLNVGFQRIAPGAYQARFDAPSPHFWLTVRIGRCSFDQPVSVIAGRTRFINAFPFRPFVTMIHGEHWIDGTLPDGVGAVLLLNAKDQHLSEVAMIDHSCYYFDSILSGRYILRFVVSPITVRDRPISIDNGVKDSGVRFDFSASDNQQASS